MRVLVTGASGFLGSHVVAELVARGQAVTGAARRPSRAGDLAADLAQPGAAAALVVRAAPDAVVHLAALPDIAPCK
ncbi:MAG: NAD(P)-dependent oxidoreductase, partial [Planctomycetes bacterium]|nr:NAD(P)-dependent oxidoreductase [Planctomycetota bacterium]